MRPEHDARRSIIREWMSLSRDQRQTPAQARAFAAKAVERHAVRCAGAAPRRVRAWLLPRTGKP